MNDMSSVIIAKSDQWNADDFAAGARTFTIEDVAIRPGTEQPVQIKLAGSDKVFRPCKTVSRILVAAWGADANVYRGRSLTLHTDPSVTWGGMKVGGIRVSHMSDIERPLVIALQEKKGSRKMTTVQPLAAQTQNQTQQQTAISIDEATKALNVADTLDDLKAVWTNKKMAPHRDALKDVLARRKSEIAGDGTLSVENPAATEGRADSDRGEAVDPDFDQ